MTLRTDDIYKWMDKQIEACDIQDTPVDPDDKFFIYNASGTPDKRIHVYNINNLCAMLGLNGVEVKPHSLGVVEHSFTYRGYTFFGLVKEGESNERK